MKKYFLDMDLTLAQFICKHGEYGTKKYRLDHDFFKTLKPYKRLDLVNSAIKNKDNIYILSNSPTEMADMAKNEWLKKHLPNMIEKNIIFNRGGLTADLTKAHVAMTLLGRSLTKNDILIDDSIGNLIEWEKAGGSTIHKQTKLLNAEKWTGEKITRMTQLARILEVA